MGAGQTGCRASVSRPRLGDTGGNPATGPRRTGAAPGSLPFLPCWRCLPTGKQGPSPALRVDALPKSAADRVELAKQLAEVQPDVAKLVNEEDSSRKHSGLNGVANERISTAFAMRRLARRCRRRRTLPVRQPTWNVRSRRFHEPVRDGTGDRGPATSALEAAARWWSYCASTWRT